MKKLAAFVLALNMLIGYCYSQKPLNDYYKFYYKIVNKKTGQCWDMALSKRKKNNVQGFSNYHGGENQKWLILPVTPGREQVLIVNKLNGGMLDISHKNNAYINHQGFTANDNQIFRLMKDVDVNSDYYFIGIMNNNENVITFCGSSKKKNPFVKPSKSKNNIYSTGLAYADGKISDNQLWELVPVEQIENSLSTVGERLNTIIKMPPQLKDSIVSHVLTETGETITGEVILPFPLVLDDSTDRYRAHNSPFYRLERSELWKLTDTRQCRANSTQTWSYSYKGIADTLIYNPYLDIYFPSLGSSLVCNEFSELTAEAFRVSLNYSIYNYSDLDQYANDESSFTATIKPDENTFVAVYTYFDRYKLYRMNSETPILSWLIERGKESISFLTYPNNLGKNELVNKTFISQKAVKENSSNGSINNKANENLYNISLNLNVYPNPVSKVLNINIPEEKCLLEIYNSEGQFIKSMDIRNNISSIDCSDLKNGIYVFHFILNSSTIVKKVQIMK